LGEGFRHFVSTLPLLITSGKKMAKRNTVAKTLQIPKKIGTGVKRKRRRVSKKNPKILLKELGVASNLK